MLSLHLLQAPENWMMLNLQQKMMTYFIVSCIFVNTDVRGREKSENILLLATTLSQVLSDYGTYTKTQNNIVIFIQEKKVKKKKEYV
jgi:hypothetical protein